MKLRDRAKMPGLRLDDGATEIAMIWFFDLLFQSFREYFGDVSEFHFFCRILVPSEIVNPSSGKVIRG
jgi:hypothetical protein